MPVRAPGCTARPSWVARAARVRAGGAGAGGVRVAVPLPGVPAADGPGEGLAGGTA